MIDLSFSEISEKLKTLNLPDFDVVVGIARGGIVPASLIAYKTGKDLKLMSLNYRDDTNKPQHDAPVLLKDWTVEELRGKKILLVDDVSVSGKTMEKAKELLVGIETITFAMKGKADIVLFPNISDCVNWPWKI